MITAMFIKKEIYTKIVINIKKIKPIKYDKSDFKFTPS